MDSPPKVTAKAPAHIGSMVIRTAARAAGR